MRDCDDLYSTIKTYAVDKGLIVFEDMPNVPSSIPDLTWNGDWQSFLDCAVRAEVKLVYVKERFYDPEETIADFIGKIPSHRLLLYRLSSSETASGKTWLESTLMEAILPWAKYTGKMFVTGIVWMKDSIAHHWAVDTDWHSEMRDTLDQAMENAQMVTLEDQVLRSKESAIRLQNMAIEMANHPRFPDARSKEKREYMASELFGDDLDDSYLNAYSIAARAELVYWWSVDPAEQASKSEKARQLRAQGEPIRNIVAILKMPESKVRAALNAE